MKKLDLKKIIVILVAFVLVISLLIIVIKNGNSSKKLTEEMENTIKEEIKYLIRAKNGYATNYNGIELLFEEEKITKEDLTDSNLLNTASMYVTGNEENSVPNYVIEELKGKGYDLNNYTFYKGEQIRESIKKLFGIEWKNKNVTGDTNFIYDFFYDEDYDIYLKTRNSNFVSMEQNNEITYKIIDTKYDKKDTIKVRVKIAYVYFQGSNTIYYSDIKNKNKIFENTNDEIKIDEEYMDSFDTYTITLKKVEDNYVFESIEKKEK